MEDTPISTPPPDGTKRSAASIVINPTVNVEPMAESDALPFWADFGFQDVKSAENGDITAVMPHGVIAFVSNDEATLNRAVKLLPGPPFCLIAGPSIIYLYRVDTGTKPPAMPPVVTVIDAGQTLSLPHRNAFKPDTNRCQSVRDLPMLANIVEPTTEPAKLLRPVIATPLTAFSLRGQAAKFEEMMIPAVPVLGDLCLAGQSTVWYAAPNAGKTLIALRLLMEAIHDQRIEPGNAYYINADDGNEGFATKLRILDDLGAHTLSPGFRGLHAPDLSGLLREMAETDSALGTIVIVDTLKKFADLMHKKEASAFGDAARQYVMKGGTFLGLAHINKNPGPNGKPSYAGVADIVQDADAAYMMAALADLGDGRERVIQFDAFKLRGPGVGKVAYAYAAEDGLTYHERLASVRVVDPKSFEEFERFQSEKSDTKIISAITACIDEGVVQKMALAKAAAQRAHVPERAAIRTLEAYTGDDPAQHRWTYSVRQRGAKVYELHIRSEPLAA